MTHRTTRFALTATLLLLGGAHADVLRSGKHIVGSWYLALDAGAFNPALAGTFLSGIAQFHRDGTFLISDAGDFGAESFSPTLATPQYGAWRGAGWAITGTSMFLEGRKDNGETLGWNKVQFVLNVVDRDRVEGTVNVYFLPCSEAPPVPSPLTCPDPIVNAGAFLPASPPDVAVTLTRLKAGE